MKNITDFKEKAKVLVAQMRLEEKASQLTYNSPAIPRLNIPAYNWWNEALHGVARAGTATSFPQAIALAAMFDEDFLGTVAEVISTEGRAKYNAYSEQNDRDIYKGLTFWSPNVNIFRDPRWGRGHETYGEDPYLTARLGVSFIQGLQGDGEIMKTAACAKHFAVHSGPEAIRHEFDAVSSDKDLWETYLPAFEACVKEADVESVMGAYNRTNGEPCNGSYFLLCDILRDKWGFEGHVVSDCWAIKDFHENHKVTDTATQSVALAIDAGCDLNCGNLYLHALSAVEEGLLTEEHITRAAERLFTTRMKLGLFDGSEFDKIPYEKVECKEHLDAALKAAHKGIVLLKNDGILPLNKDKYKTIGVIGPNANHRLALKGNYHGTSSRYITVLEGIQDACGDDVRVLYSEGCELFKDRAEPLAYAHDRESEALTVVKHSDVVILCVGLDETLEGEEMDEGNAYGSGDKADLELPAVQRQLIEKVTAAGKPVVLCLMAGSAINLSFSQEHNNAILQLWYPGARGGQAAADILFGKVSPSGKLPVTFYRSTDDLPEFTDYTMKNRTYRYFEGSVLYPFGYGLTYGDISCETAAWKNAPDAEHGGVLEVTVKNNGTADTEDVIQIYIRQNDSSFETVHPHLCAFNRVFLKAGEQKTVTVKIAPDCLRVVNDKGERILDTKRYSIYAGMNQPDTRSHELTGKKSVCLEFTL